MIAGLPECFVVGILGLVLAALFLALLVATSKLLGEELHHLVSAFSTEIRDFVRRKQTVGSLNLAGTITLTIFGIIVMFLMGMQKFLGVLLLFVSEKKAQELIAYSNYPVLFVGVGVFLVISLAAVVIDNRARK